MDIYVGNLPYQTTNQELQELFEQYGSVTSARIIMERDTGRSKGFGFVEMPDNDEANTAIENLNGIEMQGRAIRVNESQPRPRNNNRRGGGNRW